MNRTQARDAGVRWYIPDTVCRLCGLYALRRTHGGKCRGCDITPNMDPREVAVIMGAPWYFPLNACTSCGKKALRLVKTGKCLGC